MNFSFAGQNVSDMKLAISSIWHVFLMIIHSVSHCRDGQGMGTQGTGNEYLCYGSWRAKTRLKGATYDPPFGFWANFGGLAKFFEALSENLRLYISKNTINSLMNQSSDYSQF